MTNPRGIAADLRRLATNESLPDRHRDNLRFLADELAKHVEQVAAEPDELEAIHAGLDPEQEIRARAAAIVWPEVPPGIPYPRAFKDVAVIAAYIRDGSRP